jgi:hypothetical protein
MKEKLGNTWGGPKNLIHRFSRLSLLCGHSHLDVETVAVYVLR